MATDSGYSNQKKIGQSQFKTIHSVGSDKYADNVITKGLIERQLVSLVISAVTISQDQKTLTLTIVSHLAKRAGEVIRFYTGNLADVELDITEVVDADNIKILNVMDLLPQVGDEVRTAYYRTPQFDVSGNIITSSGPVQFNLDGVPTEVSEDSTFPVSNTPLPTGMYIKKEGVYLPVSDSTTPADVVAVPVKIMTVGGTNINISAGDINIQTTDMGASFDSMRIGDGSGNYIGVNANQEAKVHDANVLTELETLNTVDFATEAKQDAAITILTAMAMDVSEAAQDLMLIQPDIASIKTSMDLVDDTIAIDGGAALTKFQTIGGHTGAVSHVWYVDASGIGRVDVRDSVLPTGAATSANQLATNSTLSTIESETLVLAQTVSLNNTAIPINTQMVGGSDGLNLRPLKVSSTGVLDVNSTVADILASGGITTQNLVPTGTATANSAVEITLSGHNTTSIQITGVYTGAMSVQATITGTTWITLSGVLNAATGAFTATIASASTGIFQLDCSGYSKVRVTALAAVTGTCSVSMRASTAAANVSIDSPIPTGANVIGAVTLSGTANAVNSTRATSSGTVTQAAVTVGLTAVRATVAGTAPNAARKRLRLSPSPDNTGRIWMGASTVTIANGVEIIGPDTVDFEFDSGDYYLISDTAGQVVRIMEKA